MRTIVPHVYSTTNPIGLLMPATEDTSKPNQPRETWRDWWPDEPDDPEQLLTREELLAELQREGFIVSDDDLRNWQAVGAIPYGVRRWHDGATRALYPGWLMVKLISTLRALQADGRKMTEIRQALRDAFRGGAFVRLTPSNLSLNNTTAHVVAIPPAEATAEAIPPSIGVTKTARGSARSHVEVSARAQVRREIPAELKDQIADFARVHEQAFGGRIVRAELRLIDEQGVPIVVRIDPHKPTE